MATFRCCVCGRQFEPDQSPAPPFCSRRCQQIDLARWLDEQYGLPYESRQESEDTQTRDPGAGGGDEALGTRDEGWEN